MELVGAGPCLFPRVQEKQCSASWYSTALRINEVSRGNCVYSDSQNKCDKGLSMAVDKKACPLGKVDTTTSFIFWIVPRCVKIKCGHQLEDSKPGYCVKTTKTCPGGAGFSSPDYPGQQTGYKVLFCESSPSKQISEDNYGVEEEGIVILPGSDPVLIGGNPFK